MRERVKLMYAFLEVENSGDFSSSSTKFLNKSNMYSHDCFDKYFLDLSSKCHHL